MPLPCPDCSVALPDPIGLACPACGLPLRGPDAARLYELDTRLAALADERAQVLAVLRAGRVGGRTPAMAGGPAGSLAGPIEPVSWAAVPPPPAAPARASRSPQAVLLGLGALLLLVATSVFLAVVWLLIGLVGQAVLMVGFTTGAGAASVDTARRGLGSTSAALAWLAAGLTVVAVQAGRTLGLPGLSDLSGAESVGLAAAIGTAGAAATAWRAGHPVFAAQAVLASGLVLPALLVGAVSEPAPVVAAVGLWALAVLALGARRPGLLHPATTTAVRATALPAGAVGLAAALAGGLVAALAGAVSPAEGLRCAVVVVVLAVVTLMGALRWSVSALPAAAPVVAAATLALAYRVGEVSGSTGEAADTAVAAAGVLGWLLAAALLVRDGQAGRWYGIAAGWAGAGGLAFSLLQQDWWAVSASAAALAAGLAAVVTARRDDAQVRAVALPVAVAAAGGALAAGLVAGGARTLTVVVSVAAVAALATFVAAWRQEEPEEPGLGAVALVGLAGALTGALALPEPARVCAALLAAGGVLGLGYACLPRRGWVAPLGVVLSAAASWTLLADSGEGRVEAYTLPVALLLLVVGLVRRSREPQAPSWTTVGPAVAMALLPSAQVAAADPGSFRILLTLGAAAAVLLLGVRLHLRALVITGGLVVAELALVQLGQAALYLPRWLVLATLGSLLLGAGATYESRLQQARAAGRWVGGLR